MSEIGGRKRADLAIVAMVLLCVGRASAADVQLSVDVAPQQIYLGDSAKLTVKVSGISDSPEPDLTAIQDCTYTLQGSQNQNYQHVTIVNGKMKRTGFRGRIFTYAVTPTQTGRLSLGPVRLSHKGKVYQATGPVITVVGAEIQDLVFVRLESSRDRVIVNEPFDITVAVSIRRLTGGYSGIDPFETDNPPDVTIPHLQLKEIPGLEGEDPQKLLQGLVTSGRRAPGFGINGITLARDPLNSIFSFDGPIGGSRAIFRFKRSEATIDGKAYLTYRLKTRYVPKQENSYVFGPIVFKGSVFTAVNTAGQATPRQLFTTAPALTVRVAPPPITGRPRSYVGAIGSNLVVEATLDTQTCNVGDPLRLSLTVRGTMSVDNLRAPALTQQERLNEAFRVYDDTVESKTLDDGKTFTYTVRPIRAGTLEFPPIELAYYDSQERTYRTIRTAPIPLVAYQATEVQENFVLAATNEPPGTVAGDLEGLLIPAPITVSPTGSKPAAPWLPPWQRLVLILGPVAFILLGTGVFIRVRLTTTAESRHRKAAVAEALRLVERAARKAGRAPAEGRTLLVAGLRKYLANRLGGTEGGITPRDAARLLRKHGVDADLSHALVDVLDRSFNAQYDPSAASDQDVQADAGSVRSTLKRLEKIALTACLLMGLTLAAGADDVRDRFLWEEANTHMATAITPQDYLEAADTYRELYGTDIQNGPLLYNMGTALLMAEQYEAAQRAFSAAEVFIGATPAIERNTVLAIMAGVHGADAALPWYRLPMFWHFKTPIYQRITLTVLAITAAWGIALLRLLGWRAGWRRALALVVAAIVVLGSSVLISLHKLHQVRSVLLLPGAAEVQTVERTNYELRTTK